MSDRAPTETWHERKCREANALGVRPIPDGFEWKRIRRENKSRWERHFDSGYFPPAPIDWDARYAEHMRRVSERIRAVCGEEVRRAG